MSEAVITPPDQKLQGETPNDNQDSEEVSSQASESNQETENKEQLDGETSAEAQEEDKEGKKPTGIERRFKKFQAKLDQQAQELEYWKNVAIQGGPKQQAAPQAQEAPKLADFDNVEDYITAREQHLRQQLIAEMQHRTAAEIQTKQVVSTYEARVREAQKELPDWQDVMMEALDEPTMPETVEFCLESEVGPKIAYHLAKNPELHERLNSLSPARRLAELGKLEDKLSSPKGQAPKVTKAPQKMADVKGNGDVPVSKNTSEAKSYAEWKALRERNKSK